MTRQQTAIVKTTRTFLDIQAERVPKAIVPIHESMILDGEAKYVTVRFDPEEYPTIELMHLTDLQFGHQSFKTKVFDEFKKWILARPNCFVLLGGDLIDAATPISVANPKTNKWGPSEQVEKLIELLMPLQARILAYVGGNHERRTDKTFGDAGRLIATLLRIPYSQGIQHVDIWYGDHKPFKVSLWHGAGSARTKGAKAQMLHRFMHQGDSQVYLVGHLHDVVLLFDWRQQRTEKAKIALTKIAGVMSSSFQDYWNTYAEQFGLSPSETMMARVILEPDGGWEVTLR